MAERQFKWEAESVLIFKLFQSQINLLSSLHDLDHHGDEIAEIQVQFRDVLARYESEHEQYFAHLEKLKTEIKRLEEE